MTTQLASRLILAVAALSTCSTVAASTLYLSSQTTLFTVDQTTPAITLVGSYGGAPTVSGLTSDWRADSFRLWGVDKAKLLQINPTTGQGTVVAPFSAAIKSIAFDVTTNQLYGVSNDNLYRVDPNTAALTLVGPTIITAGNIAFDLQGNLYGDFGPSFRKVDKSSGATTVVNPDGFNPGDAFFLAVRPEDGVMIAVNSDVQDPEFYQVNTTTGKATFTQIIPTNGFDGFVGGRGLAFSAVPEPTTCVLLTGAIFCGVVFRRPASHNRV